MKKVKFLDFTDFLKNHHALKEYEEVVTKEISHCEPLKDIFEHTHTTGLLEDECNFFHEDHDKGVNWPLLDLLWKKEVSVCSNCAKLGDRGVYCNKLGIFVGR